VTDFGSLEQIGAETPYAGIARRVLNTSKATVQEYRFDAGATFPIHHHPQEQFTLVLEGEISFSADGESWPPASGRSSPATSRTASRPALQARASSPSWSHPERSL